MPSGRAGRAQVLSRIEPGPEYALAEQAGQLAIEIRIPAVRRDRRSVSTVRSTRIRPEGEGRAPTAIHGRQRGRFLRGHHGLLP